MNTIKDCKKCLRAIYNYKLPSYQNLLPRFDYASIIHKNLQVPAVEAFTVVNGSYSEIYQQ